MASVLGVIPARFNASRFPGKPLVDIAGKPMIQRVYERCLKSTLLSDVIIATDDDRIEEAVKQFGGKVMRTSPDHINGTSRCFEVFEVMNKGTSRWEYLVNIQGDEPVIEPEVIDTLILQMLKTSSYITTLLSPVTSVEAFLSQDVVKVVRDAEGFGTYFSRAPIPFPRNGDVETLIKTGNIWKHIGIYGFPGTCIPQVKEMQEVFPEKTESLEQLRWLYHGLKIMTAVTTHISVSIDTPEDLHNLLQKSAHLLD